MSDLGCDYQGHEFGAVYPDSVCIEGYLFDADNCDDQGNLYGDGDWPCPQCNRSAWREYHREAVIEDAWSRCHDGKSPYRNCKGGRLWGYAMQTVGWLMYQRERLQPNKESP